MTKPFRTAAVVSGLAIALAGCSGGGVGPMTTTTVTVTATPSQSAKSWVMPDERGKSLQRAQDDLQALTGNPMFVSTSEDLTGKGRQQIMDRHWQVCSSTPPAGATFTSQMNVVFGVVKNSEDCP